MERLRHIWLEYRFTILFVIVVGIAWLFLRSPMTPFGSANEVAEHVGQDRPVVLYFFSNTCSICLMAKPAVDGLQADLEQQGVELMRFSISDGIGTQVARQYGVRGVPTMIVLDKRGKVGLSQVGQIDVDQVLAYVTEEKVAQQR
ncbi:MAG: peroxiredoxin family protein [Anaerolineae bacterium]|jgi:thiol-disulfide isomerase/thioredoxin|nr:thioredoxin family protein [Chloroflexota bacterium]